MTVADFIQLGGLAGIGWLILRLESVSVRLAIMERDMDEQSVRLERIEKRCELRHPVASIAGIPVDGHPGDKVRYIGD